MWTGLVWLRIGTGGELLLIRFWTFGFHKMLRNYHHHHYRMSWSSCQQSAVWVQISAWRLAALRISFSTSRQMPSQQPPSTSFPIDLFSKQCIIRVVESVVNMWAHTMREARAFIRCLRILATHYVETLLSSYEKLCCHNMEYHNPEQLMRSKIPFALSLFFYVLWPHSHANRKHVHVSSLQTASVV
jgi:hypothetical protein